MNIAERVDALINTAGKTITYENVISYGVNRTTLVNAPAYGSISVKASIRQYKAHEITGLVQANDREVRIAALGLTFTPKQNDKITIDSKKYNVESAYVRSAKDVDSVYIIRVRGNN